MNRLIILLGCICWTFLLLGCSSDPTKHEVTGVVDIDGAAVEEGSIAFIPKDQSAARAEALIKAGKYKLPVVAGSYTVQIFAQKKVPLGPGEAAGTPGEKEKIINAVPGHYNEANPILAEVKGPGATDFHLTSKKK